MQNLGFDEEEDVGMVLKYLPTDCLSDAKKKQRKKERNQYIVTKQDFLF